MCQTTHLRARFGPWWPLGDFGFRGYHWGSNSQRCALSVRGDLWGICGAPAGSFAQGGPQEHSGVWMRGFQGVYSLLTVKKSYLGQRSSKQEKTAFSCVEQYRSQKESPGPLGLVREAPPRRAGLALAWKGREKEYLGRFPSVAQKWS